MSSWQRRTLDRTLRAATPLEADLIEALAHGVVSRRDFLRRGAVLGLSGSVVATVLAACGSDAEVAGERPAANGTRAQVPGAEPTSPPEPPSELGAAPPAQNRPPVKVPAEVPVEVPSEVVQSGGTLRVGTRVGESFTGLDPVNMLDFGTYSVVSQSFEYLVGLGADGFIGPTGLATSWSPNEDGTQWVFSLRPGVNWHDGSPFTAQDVAATVDRMVVAGAGLSGVVSEGAAEIIDAQTVVINLDRPMGNLPVLLSIFNPQSVITPSDYGDGTTLDARPNGTGPWRLQSHDSRTFETVFEANPNYWGGRPFLDQITLTGFETSDIRAAAFLAGEIDVIQDLSIFDQGSLFPDEVTVLAPPSANHRQVWFNTQLPTGGPFTDALVRRAVAHCVDRRQVVDEVYLGRARIANDHAVHPSLPFFDETAVPQRGRDIELARQLLAEAGVDGISVAIQIGEVDFSADLARVLQANCADAGIQLEVSVTENADFYGDQWCPGASWGTDPASRAPTIPCGSSAQVGIVDWGHRPVPDIYLGRSLTTDGDWNASNFSSPAFDASFADYDAALDVDAQRRAVTEMQQIVHRETPAVIAAMHDYLAAHRSTLQGVEATAVGHLKLERAQWTTS